MTAALAAAGLYRFFHAGEEEVLALRGISVSVHPGELVAVTGPSGSGKSTLLACLAGLDDPDGGSVHVAGHRISRIPQRERARLRAAHLGILLQTSNLFEHLSVAANVRFVQQVARSNGDAGGAADVDALLSQLGLEGRGHARPGELSGGESARAGLAVALANDPAVLLADEPTGELDSATEVQVLDLLRRRADLGLAVLVVTHSTAVAQAADRVVALADGQVVG
jgi:putative ABC transport system ATP-binding protein